MTTRNKRKRVIGRLQRLVRKLAKAEMIGYLVGLDSSGEDNASESDDESIVCSTLYDVILLYLKTKNNRYLGPQTPHERAPDTQTYLLEQLDEDGFRQEFRTTRTQFFHLVEFIQDDPVFSNNAYPQQALAWLQLVVTLKRLGCYGNGAAVGVIARFFQISVGSVLEYTNRWIMALLALEEGVVTWPGEDERHEISRRVRAASDFPSCIGFVDGSLFVFDNKPELNGTDYYSRKGRYGMAGLVVCDDQKRICYLYTGWAGCSHDARLMDNSDLALRRDKMFARAQYLLTDSGFSPETTIVPCAECALY